MATWEDVRRLALSLREATERRGDLGQWRVRDKLFAWERPLRQSDLESLGDAAPTGSILAVRVPDLGAKDALLLSDPAIFFTTAHFDGYPIVLVQLEPVDPAELEELLVEAWLARAPKTLVRQYAAAAD